MNNRDLPDECVPEIGRKGPVNTITHILHIEGKGDFKPT